MRLLVKCLLLFTLGLLLAFPALAQDSSRPPIRAFLTINLEAGYPLDPLLVSVIGGGNFDASSLGEGCSGFINTYPTAAVNYTGEAEMLQAFFYSEHDPTLIVQLPDGTFLCNDDASELLLDPSIRLFEPQQGTYAVWVGSFSRGQRIPGILVLSADPNVTVGGFDPGALVNRAPLPVNEIEPRTLPADTLQESTEAKVGAVDLSASSDPSAPTTVTEDLTVGGDIPAFNLNLENESCGGFVSAEPSYVFNWTGTAAQLRVFFESEADSTLIIKTPNGSFVCNDDAAEGTQTSAPNLNPLVEITEPLEGAYWVYIGGFDAESTLSGRLTVTESLDLQPAELARPS